jgi:hypothetical protein
MRTAILAMAVATVISIPAHAAMTAEECSTAWTAADANGDGILDESESARYAAALRVAEQPVPQGMLDQAAFAEYCAAGYFDVTAPEAGAPFEGANSFTEGQAQDRVLAAGFTSVSALTQDDNGIWRGTAQSQGQSVNVAVDFKGNVVASNM